MPSDYQSAKTRNAAISDPIVRSSWWESKLVILVLGSLLIPLALSVFQHHYERVKWITQSRYDAQHSKAKAMREFLSQIAVIEADVLEVRTLALSFSSEPDEQRRASLFREFSEARIAYYQQVGKANGNLNIFSDRDSLRRAFDSYQGGSEDILREAAAIMVARKSNSKPVRIKAGYYDAGDPANKIAMDTTALSQKQYASLNGIASQALDEIEVSLDKHN